MADAVKACANCGHAREVQQQYFCCRFPPQVVALPIVNRLTQQAAIAPQSKFPAVEAESWCGEYAERVQKRLTS